MIPRYEAQDADRFRHSVNGPLGPDRTGLSRIYLPTINILGVWVWHVVTLWLALRIDAGWSALALWLLLAVWSLHLAQAMALRRYNPSQRSALVPFLPLSIWHWLAEEASTARNLLSAILAILIQAAILLRAARAR